jgi:hypothetical protein
MRDWNFIVIKIERKVFSTWRKSGKITIKGEKKYHQSIKEL